jgi:hypothetical protein
MKKPLAFLAAALLTAASSFAATDQEATAIFQKLLDAQAGHDYPAFVADATDALKAALSQTQFEAASSILDKRFKGGYQKQLLGELNQSGCQIYLFKITCKDGGDDIQGTMALRNDKVAGILFK